MSDGLVQLKMKNILSLDADKVMQLVDLELTPLLEYLPTLVKDFRYYYFSKVARAQSYRNWTKAICPNFKRNILK